MSSGESSTSSSNNNAPAAAVETAQPNKAADESRQSSMQATLDEFRRSADAQFQNVSNSMKTVSDSMQTAKDKMDIGVEHSRNALRMGIHAAVETTNQVLAQLEQTQQRVRDTLQEPIHKTMHVGQQVSEQIDTLYVRRHEYGPYLVGGSALLFGGFMALRRGRLPGALAGTLAGGAAYVAIYDPIALDDVPDLLFGKRNNN